MWSTRREGQVGGKHMEKMARLKAKHKKGEKVGAGRVVRTVVPVFVQPFFFTKRRGSTYWVAPGNRRGCREKQSVTL